MRLHFRRRALWPSIPHDPGVTQRADVLVLEDNPTELEEIVTVTEACGLDTLATRSPQQAIRLLRANDPVLAILDWNMRLSPDAERTAENVLRTLARDHPETFTIVFALRAGSASTLTITGGANPTAVSASARRCADGTGAACLPRSGPLCAASSPRA